MNKPAERPAYYVMVKAYHLEAHLDSILRNPDTNSNVEEGMILHGIVFNHAPSFIPQTLYVEYYSKTSL